jgi:hypothetical protein
LGRHHYIVEPNISLRLHHHDAITTFLDMVLDIVKKSEAGHASGIKGAEGIKKPCIG